MTSYLGFGIRLASQVIFQYNMADLLHLVGLGLLPFGLQVQNLLHALTEKDVMTASNALAESEVLEQAPQAVKGNIGVGGPAQDFFENLLCRHPFLLLAEEGYHGSAPRGGRKGQARGPLLLLPADYQPRLPTVQFN